MSDSPHRHLLGVKNHPAAEWIEHSASRLIPWTLPTYLKKCGFSNDATTKWQHSANTKAPVTAIISSLRKASNLETKQSDGNSQRTGMKDSSPQLMSAIFVGNLQLRAIACHWGDDDLIWWHEFLLSSTFSKVCVRSCTLASAPLLKSPSVAPPRVGAETFQ